MSKKRNSKKESSKNILDFLIRKRIYKVTAFIGIFMVMLIIIPMIFADLTPIRSVEIYSEHANYRDSEAGSWKITKSAKWVSKGTVELTYDVDANSGVDDRNKDVLFVLDASNSMNENDLSVVRRATSELVDSLISDKNNRVGIITFGTDSEILSDLTSDKEELLNKINNFKNMGATNYYRALVDVATILEGYKRENDREFIVLFLTDGWPTIDTPNEIAQYNYLKSEYPFVTFNGIQYEMGSIDERVKRISDNQYSSSSSSLKSVLYEAIADSIKFDYFDISDYIDTNYFYVDSEKDIDITQGDLSFDSESQRISWNFDTLKENSDIKMTIKARLKNELIGKGGIYPTSSHEKIRSKFDSVTEDITSKKTPILADNYKVTYDGNAPSGCRVEGVPLEKQYSVFDTVGISDVVPKCDGYKFMKWDIVTEDVKMSNDDYFTMPEEDVTVRAKWSKLEVKTSLDGEIYEYAPTLEKVTYYTEHYSDSMDQLDVLYYQSQLHKYRYSLTRIVIQDELTTINNSIDILDLSEDKSESILAYIVPNEDDSSKYTAYIQCDGDIFANKDSSHLFAGFSSLESIEGLENLNTSKVTNMTNMFGSCYLDNLDITSFDTSNVTNMSFMFASIDGFNHNGFDYSVSTSNLKNLKMDNLDISKVTNMKGMFAGTVMSNEQLNSIFGKLDTSNVKDMSYMFYSSRGITSLDLSGLNTSNVTNMNNMFSYCRGLTDVNFSNFDISSVKDMSYMFNGCENLEDVNFNNADTSSVNDMSYMFNGCENLEGVNFNNVDTSSVKDMSYLFQGCRSLTHLDLSGLNTSNVTSMSYMFSDCRSLTNLDLSGLNTSNVTSMSFMFGWCESLISLDLSNFDTSKVTDMSNMFRSCGSLITLNLSSFDTSNVTNMSGMFEGCSGFTTIDLSGFDTSNVTSMSYIFAYCSGLTYLDLSSFDTSKVTNMNSMFYRCLSLVSLDLSGLNTSNVEVMVEMFSECSSLTTLNISSLDTSNVTNMESMFNGCSGLTNLDLSGLKTSNVTDMGDMFAGCSSLTSLDLSSLDTLKVEWMGGMFRSCSSLVSLNLTGLNISSVTNMSSMFSGCSGLTNLDLSELDVSNVKDMEFMFSGCSGLTNLDLSGFKALNVTDMSAMFEGCSSLTSLDLSSFDTSKVTDMGAMFNACGSLTNLDISSFNTSNVARMEFMFKDCGSLTSLDVSSFDTSKVRYMYSMFENCMRLENLDISNFDTGNLYTMQDMFKGCVNLENIILGNDFNSLELEDIRSAFEDCVKLKSLGCDDLVLISATRFENAFKNCQNLSATITVRSKYYYGHNGICDGCRGAFSNAATAPDAKIVINYASEASLKAHSLVASASENSNVVLGKEVES